MARAVTNTAPATNASFLENAMMELIGGEMTVAGIEFKPVGTMTAIAPS
jgi:hypothetical protein